MPITLTGNKYTGTLSSTGTNTLTDTGASFVSGDFNTPRMAWLFRSGSAVGLARVNSYISGTVLALDQPFFDYEGDEVTQVSGDTYYISQTATEVATTGWAVSGEVITVTDKVNFGTAGSKTSLFLHIEDYNIIASWAYTNLGPSAFEHNGGCTTFGNPLSLKKRITSSPCRIQSTVGVDGQLTDCGDVAATLMHFGTSFSGAGSVVRIGGGNHFAATPGFWQVYCNCVSDSCDFVSPDAKAWTSRASFQRVYNLTSSGAGLYFINLRWADGYVEGGAFRGSGLALSVTGSDNAGTYNFGAPAEQRLAVIDHIKAIWRTGTAGTQTMNATNVLIKDSIKIILGVGTTRSTNGTQNYYWKENYSGLLEDTKIVVLDKNSTIVHSQTIGASGISTDISLLYQNITHPTSSTSTVTTSSPWTIHMMTYGTSILSLAVDVFDDSLAGNTVKNISWGGPQSQGTDLLITETTKTTVDAYTTLDDAYELYDRAKSYLYDNYAADAVTIVSRSGSQIVLDTVDLVIKGTGATVFAFAAGAIDIKSSTFTGGATATTGEVTLTNGALLNGGTFNCSVNIDNTSDGDTYTNVMIDKLIHTGAATKTLTLSGGTVTELEVTGGVDLTVYLAGGASITTETETSGTITTVSSTNFSLSGLIAGSEVRVYEAGTTTEIDGIESSTTTFATTIAVSSVDLVIFNTDYKPIRTLSINTSVDVALPIQQIFDRNYNNP